MKVLNTVALFVIWMAIFIVSVTAHSIVLEAVLLVVGAIASYFWIKEENAEN